MNDYIIRESNNIEADFIIDKIVEYNLSIVPGKQETNFFCRKTYFRFSSYPYCI